MAPTAVDPHYGCGTLTPIALEGHDLDRTDTECPPVRPSQGRRLATLRPSPEPPVGGGHREDEFTVPGGARIRPDQRPGVSP